MDTCGGPAAVPFAGAQQCLNAALLRDFATGYIAPGNGPHDSVAQMYGLVRLFGPPVSEAQT
jgi:hypothetical protein